MIEEKFGTNSSNDVSVITPVSVDDQTVLVRYTGLLAENGATEVYAHVGHGQNWNDTSDYKMVRAGQGFEAAIPVVDATDNLNLCFRDSADNWDNNGGENYSLAAENYSLNNQPPPSEKKNTLLDFFSKFLSPHGEP